MSSSQRVSFCFSQANEELITHDLVIFGFVFPFTSNEWATISKDETVIRDIKRRAPAVQSSHRPYVCVDGYLMQDNRVSDHRTKINYDLMTVLNGDIESAVQVIHPWHVPQCLRSSFVLRDCVRVSQTCKTLTTRVQMPFLIISYISQVIVY